MSWKQFFFRVLENEGKTKTEKYISFFFSFVIFCNITAMILETVPLFLPYIYILQIIEICSLFIFLLEYVLRIWTAPLHENFTSYKRFCFSPLMIFDFLVIAPALLVFFIPGEIIDTRILRLVRVFRIFRLKQYSDSIDKMFTIISRHKTDLISAFSLICMGVVISSTFMYYAEREYQPELFSSIPHAMYWGIITLSTIGYGDIAPVTNLGKFITAITAIMGVAIYALPTSLIGAAFYAELRSKEAKEIGRLERKIKRLEKNLLDEKEKQYIQTEQKKYSGIVSWFTK